MRVPDKVKKVPRLTPECLIGCGAYDSAILAPMACIIGRRVYRPTPYIASRDRAIVVERECTTIERQIENAHSLCNVRYCTGVWSSLLADS